MQHIGGRWADDRQRMSWLAQSIRVLIHLCALTLKAPITTAADDKFCNIFPNF